MQYFWIVCHTIVGDDFTLDKVFLQPHQAIEWGRRKATQNPESSYMLYKQPITRIGEPVYARSLEPFAPKIQNNNNSEFNWDEFEKKGSDNDIDLYR